jgi:hypothetical protein
LIKDPVDFDFFLSLPTYILQYILQNNKKILFNLWNHTSRKREGGEEGGKFSTRKQLEEHTLLLVLRNINDQAFAIVNAMFF